MLALHIVRDVRVSLVYVPPEIGHLGVASVQLAASLHCIGTRGGSRSHEMVLLQVRPDRDFHDPDSGAAPIPHARHVRRRVGCGLGL